jgi:transposase
VILWSAMGADDSLPDDVTTLKAMLRAERAASCGRHLRFEIR